MLEGIALELDDEGRLVVRDDRGDHPISAGDVVHVMPGDDKSLIAGSGKFTVLGVRRLAERGQRGRKAGGES